MVLIKKFINVLSTVATILIVAVTVLIIGTRLMGFKIYTVLSGSMEPTYHTGSVIYVKKTDYKDLKAGDAISFMMDENTVVVHRITEVIPDEEDADVLRFRTKGDANDVEDANLVHCNNVIGTPVATIPYLGYFVTYIQTTIGKCIIGIIALIMLVIAFLPKSFWEDEQLNAKQKSRQIN